MTDAPVNPVEPPSAATNLARRDDFALWGATMRPSLRTLEGPLGSVKGEPRVIRVLVALADARGRVLSRDDLLQECWDGRIVGDDAINRAIAEVRRIARQVGAGFEVETVARIGYRLIGAEGNGHTQAAPPADAGSFDRRKAVGAIAGAAALLAGGGGAVLYRQRHAKVDKLIEHGRLLQGSGRLGDDRRAERLFRAALKLDPSRATTWGWLAAVVKDPEAAREAADRALALDAREPNARTVVAFQRRDLDAWTQWEDALRAVLADDPANVMALSHLTLFYQGMGRCADSWSTNERAITGEPFNPVHQGRRALKHWIFGRVAEADMVADRALQLWPGNPTVWNARLITYAFTGRIPAATALLEDTVSRPSNLTEPSIRSWSAAFQAIATRSRSDIRRAVGIFEAVAPLAPGLAANAIMTFSYLGEADAAYRVADGLLVSRGPVVQRTRGSGIRDFYSGSAWGRTQFLFIPASAALRDDERFGELCRQMGHVAYWRRRGVWPDAFMRGSLDPAKLA